MHLLQFLLQDLYKPWQQFPFDDEQTMMNKNNDEIILDLLLLLSLKKKPSILNLSFDFQNLTCGNFNNKHAVCISSQPINLKSYSTS